MIEHEFWRVVSAGLLDSLLADMVAVTDIDSRHRLRQEPNAFIAKVKLDGYSGMAFVPSVDAIYKCWNCITDYTYNPRFNDKVVRPVNAQSVGGTLSCDDPGSGYVAMVYSWDFTEYELVGTLAENATPAPGWYVIVLHTADTDVPALPSTFLEVP